MKKSVVLLILCATMPFLAIGCVVAVDAPPPGPGVAVVTPAPPPPAEVEVTTEAPPPLDIKDPELVVVPSGDAYVYMIPTVAGVYFYDGFWYRYYGGAWFRATIYSGPWISIAVAPPVVVAIDPFYPFYLPAGYFRISWWDFHRHWRDWGHRRHWHSHPHFRHEMRRDVRDHRLRQIRNDRARGIDRSKIGPRGSKPGAIQPGPRTGEKRTLKSGSQRTQQYRRTQQQQRTIQQRQQVRPQPRPQAAPQHRQQSQHGGQIHK